MRDPVLIDGCCGAGGASVGYHRAGFQVVGVDLKPQPRYPFEFIRADILEVLADRTTMGRFDAAHISPPCQGYTRSRFRQGHTPRAHPDIVGVVREHLEVRGRPWVIENVTGAPLRNPMLLCGGAFNLAVVCEDGRRRQLRRHRLFESNVWMMSPGCACDAKEKIGVYGNGGGRANRVDPDRAGYRGNKAEASTALGIDWMSNRELSQAIPPAFTEHVGSALLTAVTAEKKMRVA